MRAWIETLSNNFYDDSLVVARRVRAWIETIINRNVTKAC